MLRHFFPGLDWEFRGFDAVLIVHVLTMFVYFFTFTAAALARLDWELVAAARSLGAPPAPDLPHVVLPLLRPALFGAAALTFMASMASFTAPYVFDTDHRYLTTAILNARTDDPATSSALAILLAATSLLCAVAFSAPARRPSPPARRGSRLLAAPGRPAVVSLNAAVAALLVAVILLPVATLVLLSFKPGGRIGSEALLANLTRKALRRGVRVDPLGRPLRARGRAPAVDRPLARSTRRIATVANVAFALLLVIGVPDRAKRDEARVRRAVDAPDRDPGHRPRDRAARGLRDSGPFGIGPPHRPVAR